MNEYKVCVIVSTLNPDHDFISGILMQKHKPNTVIIIDSESSNLNEIDIVKHEFTFLKVKREYFDHGGTRNFDWSKVLERLKVMYAEIERMISR